MFNYFSIWVFGRASGYQNETQMVEVPLRLHIQNLPATETYLRIPLFPNSAITLLLQDAQALLFAVNEGVYIQVYSYLGDNLPTVVRLKYKP